MGGLGWYNRNPFVLPFVLSVVIVLLRHIFSSFPNRFRPHALKFRGRLYSLFLIIACLSSLLLALFETYFWVYQCRVSERYFAENVSLVQQMMSVMRENHLPFWVDFATLLAVLRGQAMNPWDHDMDLSTIFPGKRPLAPMFSDDASGEAVKIFETDELNSAFEAAGINTVPDLIHIFEKSGLPVTYSDERHLLQIWSEGKKGPHVDVWLWSPIFSSDPSVVLLETKESANYPQRLIEEIFPLSNTSWAGVTDSVYVPGRPHEVAYKEFKKYGGSYMVPLVVRGDCFHNFFNMRYAY